MNKLLLGSAAAALMIAPAAAGPIALTVGGYMNQLFIMSDADDFQAAGKETAAYIIHQDAEIIFKGKAKTGGLEYGFQVQLEAASPEKADDTGEHTDDQIDEHYVYVKGNWGKLQLGAENSAAHKLQAGGSKYLGFKTIEDNSLKGLGIGYGHGTVHSGISGDRNKITYFTPRFNGFQFGYSITPSDAQNSGGSGLQKVTYWHTDSDDDEITSYGIQYKGKISGAKIKASIGNEDHGGEDESENSMGLNVDYGPYGFGYASNVYEKGSDEETYTNMALTYKVSKALKVGLDMQADEVDGTDEEYEHTRIGGTYKLGSGIKLHFSNIDATDTDSSGSEKSYSHTQVGLLMKF